ncbi:Phosphatidylglycerol/phosphatidylinositol transfer protein [Colletotrichum gloeosporioides]|uniref:Phosphatidylglycerol/phosphatidylinositol transfer protein n=1 Tax=Colletotrichum gloeosporioides TaxID=474922 RepID=A0A8H4CMK7_COLGL|nr:Phosphatidylglycerol/phosphatidylinositol transfer protein [Colletotrichum gloeosporioides]KAF3806579.1 Phosphatidylglycerol/phosphatidylinositol transfer protein [Colletotrichum gloeosporioides]
MTNYSIHLSTRYLACLASHLYNAKLRASDIDDFTPSHIAKRRYLSRSSTHNPIPLTITYRNNIKPLFAMRFATAVIAFLSAGLAPVGASVLVQRDQSVIVNEASKVPGESPLEFCDKDHSKDVVSIESVDLSPNPPQAGKELIIKASGTVKETIEKGAYVLLQVKYGLIRLISTKADLCEQIENVDLECPIEKGVLSITKSVELPNEIPSGKYTVFADVYTADDEPITCLTASVVFSRSQKKSFFSLEL